MTGPEPVVLPITPPPKVAAQASGPVPRQPEARPLRSRRSRARAQPGEGAARGRAGASSRTAAGPRSGPRPPRTARGIDLAELRSRARRSTARRSTRVDRPLARLDVRDHRVEHLGDPVGRSTTVPRLGRDLEVVVADEQELHLVDDLHQRRRALLRDRRPPPRRPSSVDAVAEARARRTAAPARRARRDRSRRIHSPFSQSSFFAVEARGRRASPGRGRTAATSSSRVEHLAARRPAPTRAARGS